MCIAAIAQYDWPEQWPGLFDGLIGLIRSGNVNHVHGAIKCLSCFSDYFDTNIIPKIAPVLFPELFQIVNDPHTFNAEIRLRSLVVMGSCLEQINHMNIQFTMLNSDGGFDIDASADGGFDIGEHQQNLANIAKLQEQHELTELSNVIPTWIPSLIEMINEPGGPSGLSAIEFGVQSQVMKMLAGMARFMYMESSSSKNKGFLPNMFSTSYRLLQNCLPLFEAGVLRCHTMIEGLELEVGPIYDEEGAQLGLEILISNIFEFLQVVMIEPPLPKSVRVVTTQIMPEYVFAITGYLQITESSIALWSEDVNQYVADEGDLTLINYTTRNASTDMLRRLVDTYKLVAVQAMCDAAAQRVEEARARQQEGSKDDSDDAWWKPLESAFYTIALCAYEIQDDMDQSRNNQQRAPALTFDFSSFLQLLVEHVATTEVELMYVRSAAIYCSTRFAAVLDDETNAGFFGAAMAALEAETHQGSSSSMSCVRVSACRAIRQLCEHLDANLIEASLLSRAAPAVCSLMSEVTNDTLHLILDTLQAMIKVSPSVGVTLEPHVTPLLIQTWERNLEDPMLVEILSDLFSAFAECGVEVCQSLQNALVPLMSSIIGQSDNYPPGVVTAALDILAIVVDHSNGSQANHGSTANGATSATAATAVAASAPIGLLEETLVMILPNLFALLSSTSETSYIQSGADLLKAYVRVASHQIALLNLPRPGGQGQMSSATLLILEVVARFLEPGMHDSAIVFVGGLITQVALKLNASLPDTALRKVLQACLDRLAIASMPSLTQSFVLMFSRLLHTDDFGADVVKFLESTSVKIPTQKPSLSIYNDSDVNLSKMYEGSFIEKNGLEFLLTQWVKHQQVFQGSYDVKITLLGLAKFLTSGDERLDAITVDGYEVTEGGDSSQGYNTRGKKRVIMYEQIPITLKVFIILVQALESKEHKEMQGIGGDEDNYFGAMLGNGEMGLDEALRQMGEEEGYGSGDDISGGGGGGGGGGGNLSPFMPLEDVLDGYSDFENFCGFGMDMWGDDEEDFVQLDAKEDPMNNIDLQEALRLTLHSMKESNASLFADYENHLKKQDLQALHQAFELVDTE